MVFKAKPYAFEVSLRLDAGWHQSAYESVQNWLNSIQRRGDSRATKKQYMWNLHRFCENCKETPDELVKRKKLIIAKKIQNFCDEIAKRKKMRGAHMALHILKSFFKYNGIIGLQLQDYEFRATRRLLRVPTKAEVYKMASFASNLRDKAALLCLLQSGLRVSTLRALNYAEVKEDMETGNIPVKIHVTGELRKRVPEATKEYGEHWTFLGIEGAESLTNYLEERKRRYGRLSPDEPLFINESTVNTGERRSRVAIEVFVKKAAKRAGLEGWENLTVHCLRKTFRATLDSGYIDGGQMPEDDKEYLMGHILSSSKAPYHNANVNTLAERYARLDWSIPSTGDKEEERLLGRGKETQVYP